LSSRLAVPAAIVIGSCVIAGAIFLTRRPPPAERSSDVPAARAAVDAATAAPPAPTPTPAPPQGTPANVTAERVAAALEAQRARFVKDCWAPSAAKTPDPPRSPYIFNVSISPEGREMARGISEVREQSRGDVAQCLRGIVDAPVQVEPPGVTQSVEVTLWLPN
jgi:hypothetical protein